LEIMENIIVTGDSNRHKFRLSVNVFIVLLVSSAILPGVFITPVNAQGDPWSDDDSDGIPNYLDVPEFYTRYAIDELSIAHETAGGVWEVKVLWVEPSGIGDFNMAVSRLGVNGSELYEVTQVGVIELDNLLYRLNLIPEFLNWLSRINLVNSSLIPEVTPFLTSLTSSDGKFRIMPVLQYKRDLPNLAVYPELRLSMYLLNGSSLPATLLRDHVNTLTPEFFSGGSHGGLEGVAMVGTQPENSDGNGDKNDEKGILDLLEEIWDFIMGGANVGSLADVLLGKLVDEIIDEIKDILKEKKWFKKIFKLVKAVAKKLPWMRFVGIVKEVLEKLEILDLPWWFPDPPTHALSTDRIDIHLYDMAGNHLLGIDYATNITTYSGPWGLYFGPQPWFQLMLISTEAMIKPCRIEFVAKGSLEAKGTDVMMEESNPGPISVVHSAGFLMPDDSDSGNIYLGSPMAANELNIVDPLIYPQSPGPYFFFSPDTEHRLTHKVTDENDTAVTDATVTGRLSNGTHTFYYPFVSLGDGNYTALIDVSTLHGGYMLDVVARKEGFLPGNVETLLIKYPGYADLSGRGAWPEKRRYDISNDAPPNGDGFVTLYAQVENLGTRPVKVQVKFTIFDEFGIIADEVLVAFEHGDYTLGMVMGVDWAGYEAEQRYHVETQVWYDHNGDDVVDTQGTKTKAFSIMVVP